MVGVDVKAGDGEFVEPVSTFTAVFFFAPFL
jgi:hypothetical protein